MALEEVFEKSDLDPVAKAALAKYEGRRGCSTRKMRHWFILASLITACFIATALFYDPEYLTRLAKHIKLKPEDGDVTGLSDRQFDDKGEHVAGFPFYQGQDPNATREELGGSVLKGGQVFKISQELGESKAQLDQEILMASEEGMLNVGHRQTVDLGTNPHMPEVGGAPGEGQTSGTTGARTDLTAAQGHAPNVPNQGQYRVPINSQQIVTNLLGAQGGIQNHLAQGGLQQQQQGVAPFNPLQNVQGQPAQIPQPGQSVMSQGQGTQGQGQNQFQGQGQLQGQSQLPGQIKPQGQVQGTSPGQPSGQGQFPGQSQSQVQGQNQIQTGDTGSVQTLGENMQEMKQRAMMAHLSPDHLLLHKAVQTSSPQAGQGQGQIQGQFASQGQSGVSGQTVGQTQMQGASQEQSPQQAQPSNMAQQASNIGQPATNVQGNAQQSMGQPGNQGQGQQLSILRRALNKR